jgi:hypothetical protein
MQALQCAGCSLAGPICWPCCCWDIWSGEGSIRLLWRMPVFCLPRWNDWNVTKSLFY